MAEIENYKRESYIDVIAGIMISWMILGHCRYFSHTTLPFFKFLGFYMPWFFYKSGMFFTTQRTKELIKKDAKKLLRFFIIYSAIGWCVWSVCGLADGSLGPKECFIQPFHQFLHHGSIEANGALWFLLGLFIVRQFSNLLISKKLPTPVLSLICCVIASLIHTIGLHNHIWWFGNVFSGMCFFLLGYWLKDKEKNRRLVLSSIFFFVLVVSAYCLEWINDFPYLYMHANTMYNGNYILFYPTAIAGIIIINNLFRLLCKYVRFRILEYIGVNSMDYYTTHWILFVVVTFIVKFVFNIKDPFMLFIVLLCASISILPLIVESIRCLKSRKI